MFNRRFFFVALMLIVMFSCDKSDLFWIETSFYDLGDDKITSIDVRVPYVSQLSRDNDATTLLCNVSVFDQTFFPLFNLVKSNFELLYSYPDDDGRLHCIKDFYIVDGSVFPSATVITMDYSGSMSNTDVRHMEEGVIHYINQIGDNDKVQIIKFASYVEVINDFTSDKAELLRAVAEPFNRGMTAFYDSVNQGLKNLDEFITDNPDHTPLVIAFTDGYDNYSRINLRDLMGFSNELQIPVYTVGLGRVDSGILSSIANETGGFFQYTQNSQEIVSLFETINKHVNSLYKINLTIQQRPFASVNIIVRVNYENALGMHRAHTQQSFSFPLQ